MTHEIAYGITQDLTCVALLNPWWTPVWEAGRPPPGRGGLPYPSLLFSSGSPHPKIVNAS